MRGVRVHLCVALAFSALLVSGNASTAQPEPEPIVITEIDYLQPGSDLGDWIELHNPYDVEIQTQDAFLVLYDRDPSGACTEYCRVDLSPLTLIPERGYVIIGCHPSAALQLCSPSDAIHHSPGSGIAIIGPQGYSGDNVEYAAFVDRTACEFAKCYVGDRDSLTGSIVRCGGYLPWNTFWMFTSLPSPGGANACVTTDVPREPEWPWSGVKTLYR